ncbi:MAG: hypothetical protein Fur0037_07490 [Planctomycetota bacterium]
MRTGAILAAALASAAALAQTFPRTPGQGVLYSHHNFYNAGWNRPGDGKPGEVCGVCHIPHVEGRPANRTNAPFLWGRQLPVDTYTMYSSPTIQGTTDPQPTGTSRFCLGCHDGTVALEMFHLGTTGSTQFPWWHRQVVPGRHGSLDLGSDHPISITYPANDPGLNPTSAPFGTGTGRTIADYLEGGKVQCPTCHDIHNLDVPTANGAFYVRMTMSDPANPSALCFACHAK